MRCIAFPCTCKIQRNSFLSLLQRCILKHVVNQLLVVPFVHLCQPLLISICNKAINDCFIAVCILLHTWIVINTICCQEVFPSRRCHTYRFLIGLAVAIRIILLEGQQHIMPLFHCLRNGCISQCIQPVFSDSQTIL